MSLSRSKYVKICSECKNRGFDKKHGIICSLTSEPPAFEGNCSDRILDSKAVKQTNRIESHKSQLVGSGASPFDTERQAMSAGVIIGIVVMLVGVFILVWSLSVGFFTWGSLLIMFIGIMIMVKSRNKMDRPIRQIREENDDDQLEVF